MLNTNVGSHSKQDPILHCSCSAAYCDEFLTQAPLSQCFKIDTTQQQYTETELPHTWVWLPGNIQKCPLFPMTSRCGNELESPLHVEVEVA